MPRKTEKNVVSGVKKGRPESFDALYELYKQPIYNFIYQMTGDVEDAKDLTQDSFLTMYKVITDKKKVDNLRAYLYTVARNKTLARLAKRSKEYYDEDFIPRSPDESMFANPERAAQHFIDEYLPELEVENMEIVEESVDESLVSVSGRLDREGAADPAARQELLDCFLEVNREDMEYEVRSIQKEN
ncbi:MAG: sigma-70 family RNA polymerase sigma factor [Actinobacteria bacterium]|nr:sigma-70 family RNA polymerase sigma factor [Actinomycetota bacterium]MBU4218747.1 sigma-70 family RNA polymerase sigma factor [Actinomycetota bacterium]MBU4359520.1 sigma-70 family RNA polymerase sigma factor [Actinomycetota bacterium]MBU4401396.1 sigma-70 family RNA polymerase sigma factor [Actinomycetota bacterium]MCG2819941.1 sigma-70 family RNA polymerase sigma factor [Actinomycetes bacterium]